MQTIRRGALIAGRVLDLPQVQIGTGFAIPPQRSPMPSIRPWDSVPQERLRRSEEQLTDRVNRILRSFRGRELESLADLFATEARVFTTFPELDPFGPRPDERYIGPVFEDRFGERATWQDGDRPRIFAYLRGNVPGVGNILRALKSAEASTVCVFPDVRPPVLKELASERLLITPRPLRLDSILPQADLALLYGGHGVVCAALVAGVPLLIAPHNVEQYLHAKGLESAGVAAMIDGNRNAADAGACIERALNEGGLKARARAFAARHAGFDPARVVEKAAEIIGNVVGTRTTELRRERKAVRAPGADAAATVGRGDRIAR